MGTYGPVQYSAFHYVQFSVAHSAVQFSVVKCCVVWCNVKQISVCGCGVQWCSALTKWQCTTDYLLTTNHPAHYTGSTYSHCALYSTVLEETKDNVCFWISYLLVADNIYGKKNKKEKLDMSCVSVTCRMSHKMCNNFCVFFQSG